MATVPKVAKTLQAAGFQESRFYPRNSERPWSGRRNGFRIQRSFQDNYTVFVFYDGQNGTEQLAEIRKALTGAGYTVIESVSHLTVR